MKRNRFARLMLTGKVATLPLLIGQARADVTPSYSDMISSDLRVIEIPVGSAIRLQSIAVDANNYSASAYAGSSYAAVFCTNASLPTSTTLVVTGVSAGDNVIIAAAGNKNDPVHLQIDSRLTLGTQGLSILGSAEFGRGLFPPAPGSSVGGTVSFNVNTASLTGLAVGGKFYIQAAVIPVGASGVSGWRFSELDEIQVGSCASSSYGTY